MKKKLTIAMLSGLILTTSAMAQDHKGLTDRQGQGVTDRQGECVLTIGGTADACGAPVQEVKTYEADAFFDFDKATIKPAGKAKLDELVAELGNKKVNSISLAGHTDATGPAAYNQGLSERRAKSVEAYLVSKGVDANLINAVGYGANQPIAPNDTRENRAKNRRVDITIN